jgi:hypothetical protein
MKRKPRKVEDSREVLPVWTYAEAQRLVPYLRSVMQSLRDHQLEVQKQDLAARRLADQSGRRDRASLIAHQDAVRECQRAWDRYDTALEELHELGIFCLDAVNGQALVPFEHENQLAWFLFDLFDPQPFRFWRYDSDNLDTRRPIREVRSHP